MFLEHRFTSLGDARAKRFHAWPASHSMLLEIFSIHPSARWNIPTTMSLPELSKPQTFQNISAA
jgi:hypothetical protein